MDIDKLIGWLNMNIEDKRLIKCKNRQSASNSKIYELGKKIAFEQVLEFIRDRPDSIIELNQKESLNHYSGIINTPLSVTDICYRNPTDQKLHFSPAFIEAIKEELTITISVSEGIKACIIGMLPKNLKEQTEPLE